MKFERLQSIETCGISFDTETYLIRRGIPVPQMVCGSLGWLSDGPRIDGKILDKQETYDLFKQILASNEAIVGGANIAGFDLLVMAVGYARGLHRADGECEDIMPLIYRALSEGRVFDLQVAEALHAVAEGYLGKDPRTGGELKDPITGKVGRYSLSICTDLVLGRSDAKANDEYRLRYGELDAYPMSQWPQAALDYPVDDARNTHEIILAQIGLLPKVSSRHRFGSGAEYNNGRCQDCGSQSFKDPCHVRRAHHNLIDHADQVFTTFCLNLGGAEGFAVDQATVQKIEDHAITKRKNGIAPFLEAGVLREDESEDRNTIKKLVAIAYGAKDPCPSCNGTGKIESFKIKTLRCPECKGRCQPWKSGGTLREPTIAYCATCLNTALVKHPKQDLINCIARDGSKTCDGSGYVLVDDVPRSEKEGISYGRDTLNESGDDFLMGYGSFLEDAKVLKDYVPFLREARIPTNGHAEECPTRQTDEGGKEKKGKKGRCTCKGPYTDIPLTLRPDSIKETGRVSYSGYVQLMPRKPGYWVKRSDGEYDYVPALREAFVARPGHLLSSSDYDSGELITHGQNCIWTVGDSALARALNAKVKVHNALAATMLNISYEEYQKRAKEKKLVDIRQASKSANFGFPGLASPVTVVIQQREQGPDTAHPNGPHLVENEDGDLVRGWKGLRYCILMGASDYCGRKKVTEWNGRKIPPTCIECINCATSIKEIWRRQWPENKPYAKYASSCVDNGMIILPEALDRWPHWRDFYYANQQLEPGQIAQHVSGRLRGGLDKATAAANSFFQALLADISKHALRQASRECYDSTFIVRDGAYAGGQSPLYGSRIILFAHDELVAEHPESVAHEAATRIGEIMVTSMRLYCPDLWHAANVEPALMCRWLKSAKAVFEGGRLVPWEPPPRKVERAVA